MLLYKFYATVSARFLTKILPAQQVSDVRKSLAVACGDFWRIKTFRLDLALPSSLLTLQHKRSFNATNRRLPKWATWWAIPQVPSLEKVPALRIVGERPLSPDGTPAKPDTRQGNAQKFLHFFRHLVTFIFNSLIYTSLYKVSKSYNELPKVSKSYKKLQVK